MPTSISAPPAQDGLKELGTGASDVPARICRSKSYFEEYWQKNAE